MQGGDYAPRFPVPSLASVTHHKGRFQFFRSLLDCRLKRDFAVTLSGRTSARRPDSLSLTYNSPVFDRTILAGVNWMKPRFLLFALLVALFPVSLFSNTLYFPQVAFGGGYSTTFAIVNTGTTAVSGRLNIYSQGGTLRSDLGGQIFLSPGNSTRLTIPNVGPLTAVWGEFDAGTGSVQGVATFDSRDTSGRLVTSAGVLGVEADNSFLIPVDVTSTIASTGVAVANITNNDLSIEIRLFDRKRSNGCKQPEFSTPRAHSSCRLCAKHHYSNSRNR